MSKETKEKSKYYRSFWRRNKIAALAWVGIELKDKEGFLDIDQSIFVLRPELVERNLKIADLANEINLHSEIEPGECCCGLKLEFAGMPLQAQIGHTYFEKPTKVIMLERDGEIKIHCQTCNQDWPAFITECSHYKTLDPIYCHRCMQDHVGAVRNEGCDGHDFANDESDELEDSGKPATLRDAFNVLLEKSNGGITIYLIATYSTLALDYTNLRKELPGIWPIISQGWVVTALVGLAYWLLSHYRGDDKSRSAKLKAKAQAIFIWAVYAMLLPGAIHQIFYLGEWIWSGFGIS